MSIRSKTAFLCNNIHLVAYFVCLFIIYWSAFNYIPFIFYLCISLYSYKKLFFKFLIYIFTLTLKVHNSDVLLNFRSVLVSL